MCVHCKCLHACVWVSPAFIFMYLSEAVMLLCCACTQAVLAFVAASNVLGVKTALRDERWSRACIVVASGLVARFFASLALSTALTGSVFVWWDTSGNREIYRLVWFQLDFQYVLKRSESPGLHSTKYCQIFVKNAKTNSYFLKKACRFLQTNTCGKPET